MEPRRLWEFYTEQSDFKIYSFNGNSKLDLQDQYVNLDIIQPYEADEYFQGQEVFSNRDKMPEKRRLYGRKVKMENIFKENNGRVIIYGSPGTGKSTLCKKLVLDFYVNGVWNEYFDEIIWVQLVTIKNPKNKAVRHLLDKEFTKKDRILYILDGFDEIQDLLVNVDEENKYLDKLRKIVDGNRNYPFLILTSRSNARLSFESFDMALEVAGFSPENVKRYVRSALEQKKLKRIEAVVIDYINRNSIVADMVCIPILLDIFLYTWDAINKVTQTDLTLTMLYELLVCKLWDKYLSVRSGKKVDLLILKEFVNSSDNVMEECRIICRLAKEWLETGVMVFTSGFYKDINKVSKTLFLNSITADNIDDSTQVYEFIHLTVLEFFAALEVINWENEKFKEFVVWQKFNPEFSVVFRFIAGLLASDLHNLDKWTNDPTENNKRLSKVEKLNFFFDYLECEPNDIVGISSHVLVLNCMQECSKDFDIQRQNSVFNEIATNVVFLRSFPNLPPLLVEMLVKKALNHLAFYPYSLPQISDQCMSELNSRLEKDHDLIFRVLCKQRNYSHLTIELVDEILSKYNITGKIHFGCKSKSKLFYHYTKYFIDLYKKNKPQYSLKNFLLDKFANVNLSSEGGAFGFIHRCETDIYDAKELCKLLLTHDGSENVCTQKYEYQDSPSQMLLKLIKCTFAPTVFFYFLNTVKEFSKEVKNVLHVLLKDDDYDAVVQERCIACVMIFKVTDPLTIDILMHHLDSVSFSVALASSIALQVIYLEENIPENVNQKLQAFFSKNDLANKDIRRKKTLEWFSDKKLMVNFDGRSLFPDQEVELARRRTLGKAIVNKTIPLLKVFDDPTKKKFCIEKLQSEPDLIRHVIQSITPSNWEARFELILETNHVNRNAIYIKDDRIWYGCGKKFTSRSEECDTQSIINFLNMRNLNKMNFCRFVRINAMGDTQSYPHFQYMNKIALTDVEVVCKRENSVVDILATPTEASGSHVEELKKVAKIDSLIEKFQLHFDKRQIKDWNINTNTGEIMRASPCYLNLSNSGISDENIKTISDYIKKCKVYTLKLSDNQIGQEGFANLMRTLQDTNVQVRHLFLDRNLISLDDGMSNLILNRYLKKCKHLEIFDLSLNFISFEVFQKLNNNSKNIEMEKKDETGRTILSFFRVKNDQTNLIYKRLLSSQFVGMVDTIFPMEHDIKFLDLSHGCVAFAEKKSESRIRNWFSGHVVLIIERVVQGQRELSTAELLCIDKRCVIKFEIADPMQIKSRFENYYALKRGVFKNEGLQTLIDQIKDSKNIADFYKYKVYKNKSEQDDNKMNCIQWANEMMKSIVDFQIENVKLPPGYERFQKFLS